MSIVPPSNIFSVKSYVLCLLTFNSVDGLDCLSPSDPTMGSCTYSRPSVCTGSWFRELSWIPKSEVIQFLYIKWFSIV
jgi:hypothetical protein